MRELKKLLRETLSGFCREEDGSATVWCLFWLLLFAGMAGLSIDSTNAFRTKTMLQSTSDVAALAAAMSLPNLEEESDYQPGSYDYVVTDALEFAHRNMSMQESAFGSYVDPNWEDTQKGDVLIGNWDFGDRRFTPGGEPVNAVHVTSYLDEEERGNGLPTHLLRVVGFNFWEVTTQAVAAAGVNPCTKDGIIARETLFMNANKTQFFGDTCVHGQLAVRVVGSGAWSSPDALTVGANKPSVQGGDDWVVNGAQYPLVYDEGSDSYTADTSTDISGQMQNPNPQDVYPPMVDQIVEIGWSMLAGVRGYRNFLQPQPENLATMAPQPNVIVLPNGFSELTGTQTALSFYDPPAYGRSLGGEGVRIASAGNLGNLAALLGLSASSNGNGGGKPAKGMTVAYADTQRYYGENGEQVGQSGNSGNFDWTTNTTPIDVNATVPVTVFEEGQYNTYSVKVQASSSGAPAGTVLDEGNIYFLDKCDNGNKYGTLELTGTISNITLVTNCEVVIDGSAKLANVVLLTSYHTTGSDASLTIQNGAKIGSNCATWGNVRLYANGNAKVVGGPEGDAGTVLQGLQLVAHGDIHLTAQTDAGKGLSMLAGGDIHINPQALIGAVDSRGSDQSGCPLEGGVEFENDPFVQQVVLVH